MNFHRVSVSHRHETIKIMMVENGSQKIGYESFIPEMVGSLVRWQMISYILVFEYHQSRNCRSQTRAPKRKCP